MTKGWKTFAIAAVVAVVTTTPFTEAKAEVQEVFSGVSRDWFVNGWKDDESAFRYCSAYASDFDGVYGITLGVTEDGDAFLAFDVVDAELEKSNVKFDTGETFAIYFSSTEFGSEYYVSKPERFGEFYKAFAQANTLLAGGYEFPLSGSMAMLNSRAFNDCVDSLMPLMTAELGLNRETNERTIGGKRTPPIVPSMVPFGANVFTISVENETIVSVEGSIESGFKFALEQALNAATLPVVYLRSPGGSVEEAVNAATMLRNMKIQTVVAGDCVSACVMVFAGGVERVLLNGGRLGIHAASWDTKNVDSDDAQQAVAWTGYFYSDMGVDPELALLSAAIPSEEMLYLEPDEAIDFGLVTEFVK